MTLGMPFGNGFCWYLLTRLMVMTGGWFMVVLRRLLEESGSTGKTMGFIRCTTDPSWENVHNDIG